MMLDKEFQFRRTLAVVKLLHEGKTLTLPSGFKLGMAEDLEIGFVMHKVDTMEDYVSTFTTFTLSSLNNLLNKEDIWFVA